MVRKAKEGGSWLSYRVQKCSAGMGCEAARAWSARFSGTTVPLPAGEASSPRTQRGCSLPSLCLPTRQITTPFPVVILNRNTQTHTHTHTRGRERKSEAGQLELRTHSTSSCLQPRGPFLGLPAYLLLPHAEGEETSGPLRALQSIPSYTVQTK